MDEVFLPVPRPSSSGRRAIVEAYDAALADGVASIRLADGLFIDAPIADRARVARSLAEAAGGDSAGAQPGGSS